MECKICVRNCLIKPGKKGFCQAIANKNNALHTINRLPISKLGYFSSKLINVSSINPEKKVFVIGTWGCNFKCIYCINYEWSYELPSLKNIKSLLSPEDVIDLIKERRLEYLCFSINESTIYFDLLLRTFKLAKENGIRTILCTNGALSLKSLKRLQKYTDIFRIDLKGFSPESYKKITGLNCFNHIKKNVEFLCNEKRLIEITFLPIPNLNDNRSELKEMIEWVKNRSSEIPLHILKFIPSAYAIDFPFVSEIYLKEIFEFFVKNGLESVEREA